ncbi:hypothetical protein [Arthrobacter cavernae]|uniref:Integral membrane protein n=1 Tax=Arthrobacter cavernae TaxID=2817681 RepID=A0A939KMU9_9MICC|nr:hypothetical protein [Arthrobacter cavernae]MBO1268678.1 hypothetical protein [Arthrobacter cavernae]
MHQHAPLRFLRACLISTATVALAAAAHTAAGGHLPDTHILALLAVLSLAPVMLLSRYRLGLAAMTGILTTSQTALHLAFTALAGTTGHCTGPGIPGHGHHQAFAIPDCATAGDLVSGHLLAGLPGASMLAAHALATAATALLLAHGEATLWQLVAWLKPLAAILRPIDMPARARIRSLRSESVAVPHPGLRIPALRGPPQLPLRTHPSF